MSQELEAHPTTTAQTAKDLFSGACGGIAQVLIGQPFDIVKVRLQTTNTYSSALDCARKIYSTEGASAFYKGTLTPLIGIGACVSVQFGGFHYARRWFEAQNAAKANASGGKGLGDKMTTSSLSYGQYYAAGAFAGVTNSVLSGPIEHVRIRLQTQPHAPTRAQLLYPSPWACIKTLVSKAGVTHGLYKGQAVTVLREAQAYGSWFLTYEYLMNADVVRRGLKGREEVETWRLAVYGAAAGEVLWLASYPFDVVKSKMQTDGLGADLTNGSARMSTSETRSRAGARINTGMPMADGEAATTEAVKEVAAKHFGSQKYSSMRDCFAQVYRQEGIGGFWRGIGPTLLRAMPVSAATFVVAEMTLRAIS